MNADDIQLKNALPYQRNIIHYHLLIILFFIKLEVVNSIILNIQYTNIKIRIINTVSNNTKLYIDNNGIAIIIK